MYRTLSNQKIRRLALLAAIIGCGGDGGSSGPTPTTRVAQVVITPSNATVKSGGTLQFSAQVRDGAGNTMSLPLTWTSSTPAIASVSADGLVSATSPGTTTIAASGGGISASAALKVEASYDLDALGAPHIIEADYIELAKIARISRFRSGIGHDYADDVERCRSMKHYFQPLPTVDWGSVVIRSPMDGTVSEILDEQTFGKQLRLVPTSLPAATVTIFHVKPDSAVIVGRRVAPGSRLGTHISSATMSDIAIWLEAPRGRRLVSYFDAMTDAVFAGYQARGVATRASASIGAAERDASPLSCTGEAFRDQGTIPNWVDLR